jgi:O-6-methylguanine DNA methyltransferase
VTGWRFDTAFGPVTATFTPRGLARLRFGAKAARGAAPVGPGSGPLAETPAVVKTLARELERYFAKGEWRFSVPLDLSAGTEFDRAVWKALRRIPAGRTRTYGGVASMLGRPRAARAVGNACGRNPVPLVVPCHRVVAAGGIGGFGLGLDLKRRLLALEGIRV